jgi:predicted lysophospholipase L1 biosynthesis ABC-type transport system permease subunit
METKEEPRVEFGKGHVVAIAALFAGAAIAIGVPAVVLGLRGALTPQMQLWLIVLAVCTGGLTCLTAAFFGTVIPSSVGGHHKRHRYRATWDSPCETRGAGDSKTEPETEAPK